MTAVIVINPGTRDHKLGLGDQTIEFREQCNLLRTVRALSKAGVIARVVYAAR